MTVYAVKWNNIHTRIFLSASADWTLKLWEGDNQRPVMSFDLTNPVGDAAWSPHSATIFAAVTDDGKVCILCYLVILCSSSACTCADFLLALWWRCACLLLALCLSTAGIVLVNNAGAVLVNCLCCTWRLLVLCLRLLPLCLPTASPVPANCLHCVQKCHSLCCVCSQKQDVM